MLQALRGTTDLLPDDVSRWSRVEHVARRTARLYGYQELRTPLIEDASLFLRSVGETTDMVQKEMFWFTPYHGSHVRQGGEERRTASKGSSPRPPSQRRGGTGLTDRGGGDIVLRPEGTASVVRAYLEHSLDKTEGFAKLFYLGAMFRAERPQAGRYRQFHQYGVEAIGSSSPWVDVEVILLCLHILRDCGVKGASLLLSSMGCRSDQAQTGQHLRDALRPHRATLCSDCQARFDRNIFRVLDCKNPSCQQAVRQHGAVSDRPPRLFSLCKDCREHFEMIRCALAEAGVAFDETKIFARGLDYYTRTVFEIRAEGLGAQDAVAAGGRYDHLVEELGGPPAGAVGFAAGIERVLMAASHQGAQTPAASRRGVYVAVTDPALIGQGFQFLQQLRQRGVCVTMDYEAKSLKAQLRKADKAQSQFVVILGKDEVAKRVMTVKNLAQGTQDTVAFDQFVDTMVQRTKDDFGDF